MTNIELSTKLENYLLSNNWTKIKKWGLENYFIKGKDWIAYNQNKTFFSIYLANYYPLLERLTMLSDAGVTSTKSTLQIRDKSQSQEQILNEIILTLEREESII